MADVLGQQGVLQVIPPAELEQQLQQRAVAQAQASQASQTPGTTGLVGYIRGQYEIMRNHRNSASGWNDRLLHALRTFHGQYSATKLAEIKQWGGSEVYARTTAQKCRAASSLLRDIYLGPDRPWTVKAPESPDVPENILASINQLIQAETQKVTVYLGKPPKPEDLEKRKQALIESALDAAKKQATKQARYAEGEIEDILRNGGFYTAFAEFLVDLPIFPLAIIKGPVVKMLPQVQWPKGGGPATISHMPTLTWNRVSPFDFYFTPGVADVANADTIERGRLMRAELNDLLDLPGYNHDEIRAVLQEYGRGGLYDDWDSTDAERAVMENRENPAWNRSAMLTMMEFNGNIQGQTLQDFGMPGATDPMRDYHVQAWCIGSHCIKCQLSPSPRQRHPYFTTSYEKTPGSVVGNSLVDLLSDVEECGNATLRAVVNNISIASGPQVVIEDDRISPGQNNDQLYPWKRWHTRSDPVGNNAKPPVSFFMPTSNVQPMMAAYKEFIEIADDISAIPKYMGGGASSGGAGRTASGLAMLMGNSSKILQNVSANVDRDVVEPALGQLSDVIMLTDTSGILTGDEQITVRGVNVAIQRETMRQRQLEFLQNTNNPVDNKIMGMRGRGVLLRTVADTLAVDGERIVPPDEVLERREEEDRRNAQNSAMMQKVDEGVQAGVKAGVQRISSELTSGVLAGAAQLSPEMGGGPAAGGGPLDMAQDNPVDMNQMSRQAQGDKAPRPGGGMAPQTNLIQPENPNSQLSPGVG